MVTLEDGDAKDVLVQVSNEELEVEVPYGVERVVLRPRRVTLRSHRQLTVRVTLTYNATNITHTKRLSKRTRHIVRCHSCEAKSQP